MKRLENKHIWLALDTSDFFKGETVIRGGAQKQIPRSLRRNGLPVKLIDGTLLMRHEYLAGSPVKLMEGAETAPRSNRVLHHTPEAFDRVEVMAAVGG